MQRLSSAVLAALVLLGAPGKGYGQDYFQQFVHYTMEVRLDPGAHRLTGSETIEYTNNSPDTLSSIYLHLYPNAYRSKDSAFMRTYRRRYNVNLFDIPRERRSSLDVSNVRVAGAAVEVDVDDTIAHIPLPSPLPPGATTTVDLDFDHHVRRHLGRAGYEGEHYDFSQWYPKVAVYDEKGYHADPWTAGEFYGEFGTFDVHITLPARYVVAATGTVASGDPGWSLNPAGGGEATAPPSGEKTVHFHAENVHDFAWSADPTFVVEHTTFKDIDIYSVYQKKHAGSWADTTLAHAVRAMQWLDKKVGDYAYPQVTVVDALLGGGMEYPMLVMDGHVGESLVVHEVGHIYFYGILADNEFAEAWLDEGFTSFQTQWFEVEHHGPYGDTSKWNFYQHLTPQPTLWKHTRDSVFDLARRHYDERVVQDSDAYQNSYRYAVYRKPTLLLNALRYVVGDETFERILRTYYDRWKLKHVNSDRFIAVAEEVSGLDLSVFFEEWLYTVKKCDYRLDRVRSHERPDGGYDVGVVVKRDGEMIMPVTIHFTLADGSVETRRVDGRLRTITETFVLPAKPVRTVINPGNEIADIDFADNDDSSMPDFAIDWPNNDYATETAYQLRFRPGAWYNDIDGLKAGLLVRGSYYNWSRRVRLGLYYGAESDRLDFTASYDKPFYQFSSNSNFHLSLYKMEGRRDFTTQVDINKRKGLVRPPTQGFTLGINYHELTNARYLNSPEVYDTSRSDIAPYLGYSIDPQIDFMSTQMSTRLRFGRKWFGGDYQYERLTAEVVGKTRREVFPVFLDTRLFLGLVGGDVPKQEKFNLAGGGPLEQEQHYWLRSPGAVWEDLNYLQPGHGNLRGYRAGTFGVNQLFALNTQLGMRVPFFFLGRLVKPFVGNVEAYGFYDFGRAFDKNNPIGSSARVQALVDDGVLDSPLMDAGVGFVAHRNFPFYNMTLRLDLPFWVSTPEVNGEASETQLRYLLSLNTSF